MSTLRLYGTPLSHFTRKVRILVAEIGVPVEFVRVTSILGTSTNTYGDNPLMRVPALVLDGESIIDSDHIARFLVAKFDPKDRFGVRSERVHDLNRLAVANGIMGHEVTIILAKRGGFSETDQVSYFRKLQASIDSGLGWLDRNVDVDDPAFTYADIATICMWQHVVHYQSAEGLERWTRLAARVARFADRPSVASTTPEVSLADAAAAGWKPA
jgi:glutathione S-transferase